MELTNSLSVLWNAKKHIEQYDCQAEDGHTTMGKTSQFFNRTLNNLTGQIEVYLTEAIFALLGMTSRVSTENFWFVYVNPEILFVDILLVCSSSDDVCDDVCDDSNVGDDSPQCDVNDTRTNAKDPHSSNEEKNYHSGDELEDILEAEDHSDMEAVTSP